MPRPLPRALLATLLLATAAAATVASHMVSTTADTFNACPSAPSTPVTAASPPF